MNTVLWGLQILLAVHTAVGALWKFSNSEQAMPSLSAIPHSAWLALSVIELLCSVALIVPSFSKRFAILAPIAAIFIAAEMLLCCALHISSGDRSYGPLIYWLVVAAVCAFIAFARLARKQVDI